MIYGIAKINKATQWGQVAAGSYAASIDFRNSCKASTIASRDVQISSAAMLSVFFMKSDTLVSKGHPSRKHKIRPVVLFIFSRARLPIAVRFVAGMEVVNAVVG
jgi:hypothetical protein